MATSHALPPTTRQLSYLRALADRTGTTFVYPRTRAEASQQIQRLRSRKAEPEAPWHNAQESSSERLRYGTAVDPSEVSGFGSSATWRVGSPAHTPPQRYPGQRRLLAQYSVAGEARIVRIEALNDSATLMDRPLAGDGQSFVIEPSVETNDAALNALVADYIKRAAQLGVVPMSKDALRKTLNDDGRED